MNFWTWYLSRTGLDQCGRANLKLIPFNAAMTVFCILYHFNVGR